MRSQAAARVERVLPRRRRKVGRLPKNFAGEPDLKTAAVDRKVEPNNKVHPARRPTMGPDFERKDCLAFRLPFLKALDHLHLVSSTPNRAMAWSVLAEMWLDRHSCEPSASDHLPSPVGSYSHRPADLAQRRLSSTTYSTRGRSASAPQNWLDRFQNHFDIQIVWMVFNCMMINNYSATSVKTTSRPRGRRRPQPTAGG